MSVSVNTLEDGTIEIKKEGTPPEESYFTLKDLKTWGIFLMFGTKDKESGYFATREAHAVGESFSINGKEYTVEEVFDTTLPKNSKLKMRLKWDLGRLVGELFLVVDGNEQFVYAVPIEEILNILIVKKKLGALERTERLLGITTKLKKEHQPCTVGIPLEEADPKFRRLYRSAKKLFKEDIAAGHILLRYCGKENSSEYYYIEIELPTLSLINQNVADRIDKLFAMVK